MKRLRNSNKLLYILLTTNFNNMSNILKQANEIINCRSEEKDRMYGPISEGMEIASQIYNLITPEDYHITPEGMYWALISLKLSRQHYNHKEDNLLDAVAYMGALNNYIESKSENTTNINNNFEPKNDE